MPLLLLFGCVLSVRPLSQDYRDLPPDQAVDAALEILSQRYSLSAHKELDWPAISEQVRAQPDLEQALRHLTLSMPDGHVLLEHPDLEVLLCEELAGEVGLRFSDSEAGVVVVASEREDVAIGDRLLGWQGLGIDAALAQQALHCFPLGLATQDKRDAGGVRLLSTAEVGAERVFELEGDQGPYTVRAVAQAHGLDAHTLLDLRAAEVMVAHRMLTPDIGYLAIGWEESVLSERRVRTAMRDLYRDGARALVLDLRNNDGGTDLAAANIVGLFTEAWLEAQ